MRVSQHLTTFRTVTSPTLVQNSPDLLVLSNSSLASGKCFHHAPSITLLPSSDTFTGSLLYAQNSELTSGALSIAFLQQVPLVSSLSALFPPLEVLAVFQGPFKCHLFHARFMAPGSPYCLETQFSTGPVALDHVQVTLGLCLTVHSVPLLTSPAMQWEVPEHGIFIV
jgi:hypothetical protein